MTYVDTVRKAALEQGFDSSVASVFSGLMSYIEDKRWQGACHACSSVLYVALCECGIKPRLCIGECCYGSEGMPFDHSWLEIDEQPFDVACAMRLDTGIPICPPVIGGIDVEKNVPTRMRYGISLLGLNKEARMVYVLPFTDYMDGYPNERDGLWTVVGHCLGTSINVDELRKRYSGVERVYVRRTQ